MNASYTGSIEPEIFSSLVGRVFSIEDVTLGGGNQPFLIRYRGHLISDDSAAAYDQLAELLKPYEITPLFRWDGDRHAILLIKGLPTAKPSNPWISLILMIVTFFSIMVTGAVNNESANAFANGFSLSALWTFLQPGLPFAICMLGILAAHEFGHYLVSRYHHASVTLPYFIPLPIVSPFGTLGAFINMKLPPKNKRILFDIGIAGPLAGLVVALPVLAIGLAGSSVARVPYTIATNTSYLQEGNSILYLAFKYLIFGKLLPQPATYGSLPPLLYWLRFFFTSSPLPLGGIDVSINSIAWAGWSGLLVTMLNLIPAGQLDGGHIFYTLFGPKTAKRIFPVILVVLIALGFAWSGWWLWAALIFVFGRFYDQPYDQITTLDPTRKALAIFAFILLLLIFIPAPLVQVVGG